MLSLQHSSQESSLASIVLRRLRWWPIGRGIAASHTAVNNEVSPVDEAALITRKEEDALGLLNGLTEAAGGEMDFSSVALCCIIAEPILQKWSAVVVSIEAKSRLQ